MGEWWCFVCFAWLVVDAGGYCWVLVVVGVGGAGGSGGCLVLLFGGQCVLMGCGLWWVVEWGVCLSWVGCTNASCCLINGCFLSSLCLCNGTAAPRHLCTGS